MNDKIIEIRDESAKSFEAFFNKLPATIYIGDKTLQDWVEYFNVEIDGYDDMFILRARLAETSDKMNECSNILSKIKLAARMAEMNEKCSLNLAIGDNLQVKKMKITAAERNATIDNLKHTMTTQWANLILDAWETQLWKLKDKAAHLQSLLISEMSEWKHSKYQNHFEE